MQRECLNTDDPIKHYYENYAKFGIDANKIFITVAKEIQPPSPANVVETQSLRSTNELNGAPLSTTTPTVNNADQTSSTQISTALDLPTRLESDADIHPIQNPVTEFNNPAVASTTPPESNTDAPTLILPWNLSSTNSAAFQQLTSFTTAIKAPVLMLSADADGEQHFTHLVSQ